jgi:hypothetical protein
MYEKIGRYGQKFHMVFLLAVFNYTELTGGHDIITYWVKIKILLIKKQKLD